MERFFLVLPFLGTTGYLPFIGNNLNNKPLNVKFYNFGINSITVKKPNTITGKKN